MNSKWIVISAFFIVLGFGWSSMIIAADQDKGPADISLYGGKKGEVPFPHRLHQDNLGDCKTCHDVFPQKKGSIESLKAEGKLKKKHVMNKLCTKCHRQMKKAGEKSGPTTCTKCHSG